MSCPPPRARGSAAISAFIILYLTFRIGSSHSGPSRVPHWKPCGRAGMLPGWRDGAAGMPCCWASLSATELPTRLQMASQIDSAVLAHSCLLSRRQDTERRRRGCACGATTCACLDDAILDGVEQALVHVRGQRVVHQNIGALALRAEGPDGPRCQEVPLVLLLEERSDLLARPVDADRARLCSAPATSLTDCPSTR